MSLVGSWAGRRGQRGLGLVGWLVALALGSLLLTCTIRLVPVYIDYWAVSKVLEEVARAGRVEGGPAALRRDIQRRLDLNRIEVIQARDVRIEETRRGLLLDASYEQRVPLIGNIDLVVHFDSLRLELER